MVRRLLVGALLVSAVTGGATASAHCTVDVGPRCTGGHCVVNAGACDDGACTVNVATCGGGGCTVNAGYCADDLTCDVYDGSTCLDLTKQYVDPTVCPPLAFATGTYGPVVVEPDGDVVVGGEPVRDCPPYRA